VSAPDLVVAGNLLIDDIVLPSGETLMGIPGGAVLYSALAASLWGARVGVLSVRGVDYPEAALDALVVRGVDLAGVRAITAPGLRTWLLYERHGRRVVHQLGCPSHEEVSPRPEDLPTPWRGAAAVHIAPMPFAVQAPLVRTLRQAMPSALFSIDPHEPVADQSLAAWRTLLANVGAVFVSEDELRLEDVANDPGAALQRLGGGALRGIAAIRLGARGGRLIEFRADAHDAYEWRGWGGPVIDTTGAGDAFAAGFLIGRVRGEPIERCCAMGVVSASFAIEERGVAGLLAATREDAARRLAALDPAIAFCTSKVVR
jgi:sugar/nucleoside kinase (ribokinase family)